MRGIVRTEEGTQERTQGTRGKGVQERAQERAQEEAWVMAQRSKH